MSTSSQANRPPVLLISRKWPPAVGGMETYSVELAQTLAAHFDVITLVLPGRPDGRPPGVLGYAKFLLWAMLNCALRGRRFPLVVFTDPIMFPAAACHWAVAPGARRIVVVHGLDIVFRLRRGFASRAYAVYFAALRGCQRIFHAVVANSANTARLAREAGLRNVVVVNPSLPRNGLAAETGSFAALPTHWNAAPRRILYFGRLVPRKGALWFAENVLPSLPRCEFFVAGHATDLAYAQSLERCPATHCLGRVDSAQLATMIREADVVVMPNIATPDAIDAEGFGLAAVETAALGGRLFASAIDGITDAVIDGVTGRLLPAGMPDAWIEAIREAISMPADARDEARASIASAALERFSRARQLDAFVNILLD